MRIKISAHPQQYFLLSIFSVFLSYRESSGILFCVCVHFLKHIKTYVSIYVFTLKVHKNVYSGKPYVEGRIILHFILFMCVIGMFCHIHFHFKDFSKSRWNTNKQQLTITGILEGLINNYPVSFRIHNQLTYRGRNQRVGIHNVNPICDKAMVERFA